MDPGLQRPIEWLGRLDAAGKPEDAAYTVTIFAGIYGASIRSATSRSAEEIGLAKMGKLVMCVPSSAVIAENGKWLSLTPDSRAEVSHEKDYEGPAWVLVEESEQQHLGSAGVYLACLEVEGTPRTVAESGADPWTSLNAEAAQNVKLQEVPPCAAETACMCGRLVRVPPTNPNPAAADHVRLLLAGTRKATPKTIRRPARA